MSRELPHVWKRFWSLPIGTDFFIGDSLFFKLGFCNAGAAFAFHTRLVAPWRKVRTTQLVRDALPGGLSSADLADKFPVMGCVHRGDDLRDATILAIHAMHPKRVIFVGADFDAACTGKTLAYAEELRRRYPVESKLCDRIRASFDGMKPYDEVVLRNMRFDHLGEIQPHKDDERTGPSA